MHQLQVILGMLVVIGTASFTTAHDDPWYNEGLRGYSYQQQQNPTSTGPCAALGYGDRCCPLNKGDECMTIDTNGQGCSCGPRDSCISHGDCCSDNACPYHPTTCGDVGITNSTGCCSNNGVFSEECYVHFNGTHNNQSGCSCNLTCHAHGDCCSDIISIGCPDTCTRFGVGPGCCEISDETPSCYVHGGNCFCDSTCHCYEDCCTDVQQSCQAQPDSTKRKKEMELEDKIKALNQGRVHHQRALYAYTEDHQRVPHAHKEDEYTKKHKEALKARAQKSFERAMKYKAQSNEAHTRDHKFKE